MILTTNLDCTLLTAVSENNYIDDIQDGTETTCCHLLELGTNCCTPSLLLPIRSLYDFSYEVLSCSAATVLGLPGYTFSIEIGGLVPECVSSFTYTGTNGLSTTTETNPADLRFSYAYNQILPSGVINLTVVITTCNGLTYTLSFSVTVTIGDPCNTMILGVLNITYPSLPTGVTINVSNELEIAPEAFGYTTTFPDGVYFVGLSQTLDTGITSAESNSTFINCSTTCKVIDFVANNLCSNVFLIFNALEYSNDCSDITYQQKCDMWYYIGKQLGYFKTSPCPNTNTCKGCNK